MLPAVQAWGDDLEKEASALRAALKRTQAQPLVPFSSLEQQVEGGAGATNGTGPGHGVRTRTSEEAPASRRVRLPTGVITLRCPDSMQAVRMLSRTGAPPQTEEAQRLARENAEARLELQRAERAKDECVPCPNEAVRLWLCISLIARRQDDIRDSATQAASGRSRIERRWRSRCFTEASVSRRSRTIARLGQTGCCARRWNTGFASAARCRRGEVFFQSCTA